MANSTIKSKKKISDIASMFGGMAKMKKVKTPRHKKRTKKELAALYAKKMAKLKHVDDSDKNLFSRAITPDNEFEYKLRKYENRPPSPMPPKLNLPHNISPLALSSSTTTIITSSFDEKAPRSLLDSHHLQLVHANDHDFINRNVSKNNKSREEIDLNSLTTPHLLALHEEETHSDASDTQQTPTISANVSPKVSANITDLSLNKQIQTSYTSQSNEDTEIDDISSSISRSSSVNTNEKPPEHLDTKSIVIQINDIQKHQQYINKNVSDVITPEQEQEHRANVNDSRRSPVLEALEAGDALAALAAIGLSGDDTNESSSDFSTEHSDTDSSSDSDSDTDSSSDSDSDSDASDSDGVMPLSTPIKKKKTFSVISNISLDTSDGNQISYRDLFDDDGELMIGKITTPTYRKKQEIKRKSSKRAKTAIANKQWNYDELFGENNGEIVIGALKTPKFSKKKESAVEKKKIDNQYANAFDLTDLLGNDFEYDKYDKYDKYDTIMESEEDDLAYYEDDEYYPSDDSIPDTPVPDMSPMPVAQAVDNINVKQIYCESSDSDDFEPEPARSTLEEEILSQQEEEKKIQLVIDTMTAEIEQDLIVEDKNKKEIQRRQQQRAHEINTDLDGLFDISDEDSCSSEDGLDDGGGDGDGDGDDLDEEESKEEDSQSLSDYSESMESEIIQIDRMKLSELMLSFKLNSKVISYFVSELKICNANDLLNYSPSTITQPKQFKSTKTRMLLSKMAKFVTNKVLNNEWTGTKDSQWTELHQNKVTVTYTPAPTPVPEQINLKKDVSHRKKKKSQHKKKKTLLFENSETNTIQIIENKVIFVDKTVAVKELYSAQFTIVEFPEIDNNRRANHILSAGVNFYDENDQIVETVYMSDRCALFKDDSFIEMLSLTNGRMLENGSQVIIEINNKINNPTITFMLSRHNTLIKNNLKTIVLEDFKQKVNGHYAKIFIEQYYGGGIYSIQSIRAVGGRTSIKTSINMDKFRRTSSRKSIRLSRHRASI